MAALRSWLDKPVAVRAAAVRQLVQADDSAPWLLQIRAALPPDAQQPFNELIAALNNWHA